MDAEPRRQQQEEEEEEEGTTKEQDSGDGDGADAEPVHNHRGWKVMPYVIGNETFEKLGTIGTLSNMLVYLTTVYHMQSVSAATLLNVFSGTSNLATVLGAFVSDTYLGRYTTIAISIVASFLGMLLLTLTAALPSLHPPTCNTSKGQPCQGPSTSHFAALLASFFFLVVGASGVRPCSLAFGADQFDPRTADGRRGIASFFNWYYFTFTIAIMLSATVIIYLQSNVNWALGLAVPAVLMGISCVVFFMGTRLYVRVRPEGSPLTSFAQVLVAATRKRHLRRARGVAELFDLPHRSKLVSKLAYTDQFTCLDKAAMRTPEDALHSEEKTPVNPWRLCTVQQVEEAAQTDRRISSASSFQIPQGSLIVFSMLSLTLWIPVYDRLVVPALRRFTKHEGGITLLQRIGVGLALSVATMLVSAAVEHRRRRRTAMMSCFWLVPQLLLAGLSEAFAGIGQLEFFYRQFPENMRSVAGALYCLGFALASYASGVMVTVVHRATRGRDGRPDWLAQDLDQGRVDLFYLVTAAIAAVNLIYFIACARWYRFKESNDDDDGSHANGDDVELVDGRLEKSASAAPV
ncbi:protein NRT1/ PTR FAMILY 2.11-like isoform X2 [Aegilops tauschii subsp. strangulata]|uniref:protein NRT1/ PTR FAMILY 2.11-like isoform X2 n=1 Tax=Aegilops tauschii subsp. strangulata TaxID=200361 RepID=UPI001ABC936C|nr:protein NRT1/ PTR FAMILY 2.11-like isoform X2 [Aegilops tauschii subsp. strangulata]